MRRWLLIVCEAVAMLMAATNTLFGQCQMVFNVSVYNAGFFSGDYSTAYAQSNAVENSTRCSCAHGSHQSSVGIYSPSGRYTSSSQTGMQSGASLPTYGELGNYTAVGYQA